MKLPKNLISGTYTKPNLYLCETDKTKICKLETTDTSGVFRFNSYSELSCTVGRTYSDMITGIQQTNPFYNKIEALRLLHLEGFGYFEIQDPEIFSDGIQEVKNITAYSLEYSLSQKYLENFYINTGEIGSIEVTYAEENDTDVVPIVLYDPFNPKLSLLHLALEKVYGWSIGHVDASLKTMSRTFDISRTSVYDFLTQDICEKFNCYMVFDTIDNVINVYAESLTTKFIGDGKTTTFVVTSKYDSLSTVSIDTYKTTAYTYNYLTGELTFEVAPEDGAKIEVVDGSQTKWITDVYVAFDNLAQEVNVSYSADDIKTVLTVKGADDLGIQDVNFGLPYIVDLSYYYTVDWMGQDLYDAYTQYLQKCNGYQNKYTENTKEINELYAYIDYESGRLSLEYSIAEHVNSTTVGTYYVRGGEAPNYYYKEVSLPSEYNSNVDHYYSLSGNDITELKVEKLYAAMQTYYVSQETKDISEFEKLSEDFAFMEKNTIESLVSALSSATTTEQKDYAIKSFLDEMWEQLGLTPLNKLYYKPYKLKKETAVESGWDEPTNENYWRYYPVTLMLATLEKAMSIREETINGYTEQRNALLQENNEIQNNITIYNNFTDKQLIRLNAFLREDEYTDDNFVITDSDSVDSILKTQNELLECGKIELEKLCEPKLSFSMSMANIYALPEFEPIVWQFQLGNLINVAIRSDYIKRARLLEVNINFDDFSDFSCEFGELTSMKTPSSIHADLLATAMQAGKSVASNASYWNKGADLATSTDLKIQQGLLGAVDGLYNSDQSVIINDNGILLRKVNEDGSFSQYQTWLTSNNILISSDGFKEGSIPRMGLGEFTVDGETFYGVLAEAVLSGYIEGSKIVGSSFVGGTINIGDGTFVVDKHGNVTMNAISSIEGIVGTENIISSINQSPETIAIDANRISLAGKTIDLTSDKIVIQSTNFSVTKDGKITAKSGEIAGWSIYDNLLRKETTIDGVDYQMYMQSADGVNTTNAFAVRKKNSSDTSWDMQFAVNYAGKMTARNAHITGTIVAQDGSIAGYNIGSGGSYANAIYKRVSGDSSNFEVGLKATSGDTDLAFYVKESTDNWASSTNTFYIRNNGQLYAQNANITGTVNATSGNIGGCSIDNGVLKVGSANIASLDASKITSGTMSANRISGGTIDANNVSITNLNAQQITAGTLNADRIPNISASKITSGTINANNVSVTNLNASNITSGTLSTSRLSSSVITTDNFSSKSLSTGSLTVASGCRLGAASEYNALLYTVGDYTNVRAFGPDVNYGISWYALIKQAVQQSASSRDIKTEIHDFDDRYDEFFNNLNPQLYKYDFATANGYSMGYIWEETKDAYLNAGLTSNDIGAVSETESVPGGKELDRTDFIALNTWQIQKLKARVEELENKLAALEA